MGYETRMYIGSPSENVTTNGKRAVLIEDYVGNPSGSVFSIYSDESGEFFYLLDGNTRINLECALEAGVVKVLPAVERHYFSQFFVLNLSKVGSIPEGYLTEEDIICDTPELFVGGNETAIEDCYGEKLVVYDGMAVLKALREMMKDPDMSDCWRLRVAIHVLEDSLETGWEPIGVIFYGY